MPQDYDVNDILEEIRRKKQREAAPPRDTYTDARPAASGRAPRGRTYEGSMRAGSLGCADDSSKVVRILDRICDDQQRRFTARCRAGKKLLHCTVVERRGLRSHTLMVQPVGKRVKPAHIDALDWDARLFRQSDNTRDRLAARRDIVTDVNAFHFTRTLEQLNDRVAAKHKPFLQIALRV